MTTTNDFTCAVLLDPDHDDPDLEEILWLEALTDLLDILDEMEAY